MTTKIKMRNFHIPPFRLRHAAGLLAVLAAAVAAPALAGQSQSALESGISASSAKEGSLSAAIQADSHKIDGFQGSINDLQARLSALEIEPRHRAQLLDRLKSQLKASRSHLASLRDPARP